MHVAELLVDALTAYGLAGAVFAVAFVTMGIQRVDSVAEHAPLGFRLIVLPGVVAGMILLPIMPIMSRFGATGPIGKGTPSLLPLVRLLLSMEQVMSLLRM